MAVEGMTGDQSGAPAAADEQHDGSVSAAIAAELAAMDSNAPDNGPLEDDPEPGEQGDPNDEPVDEANDQQDDGEDDGQDDDGEADPDMVEVEWSDGKKYQIPKALEEGLMLKADHTRKTQEIARERGLVLQRAQQAEQLYQMGQQYSQEFSALQTVNTQLANLQQAMTNATTREDFIDANAAFTHLERQRNALMAVVQQKDQQLQQWQGQQVQERMQSTAQDLVTNHGWTKERHAVALGMLETTPGINAEVKSAFANGIVSPGVYLLLEKAAKWDALQKQKPALTQQRQPARQGMVPGNASDPRQTTRNQPVQAFEKRAKATGNVKDAIALELAHMNAQQRGSRRRR